jgi:hypothetical protein
MGVLRLAKMCWADLGAGNCWTFTTNAPLLFPSTKEVANEPAMQRKTGTGAPPVSAPGKVQYDMRYLEGICTRTAKGVELICAHVELCEYGEAENPLGWAVFRLGIEQPPYEELFPHHAKAYCDRFKS